MIEKPTILYPANNRNYEYARAIVAAINRHECKIIKEILFPAGKNLLDDASGVVFIGPQTSERYATVFLDQSYYFRFLQTARDRRIRVAAVLEPSYRLPKNNKGIDCIIEVAKGESVVTSIASSLEKFFDSS